MRRSRNLQLFMISTWFLLGGMFQHSHAAKIRLADNTTRNQGRVEVFSNGEWGTVCNDFWGLEDAQVACRQLGFPGALEATQGGSFGSGTGPIHFDDVMCNGDEDNLESCPHAGIGVHNCTHDEDAGVVCAPKVRLVDGLSSSNYEGRVEVYWDGVWGTVCDDDWSLSDATVVCRELGFSRAIDALSNAAFGGGCGLEILLNNLTCVGNEETVFDCKHGNLENQTCGHQEDIGLRCDPCDNSICMNGGTCSTTAGRIVCDCPQGFSGPTCEFAGIRLIGGDTLYRGRLEVFLNGAWGTVCDDFWGPDDAQVACRQLGFPGVIEATFGGSFGSGTGPIHLDDVMCTGDENSLESCSHAGIGNHNCTHSNDAGIVCSPSVRLMNGSSINEGRVEVYWAGVWGTICDDFWSPSDALVVCRELGFSRAIWPSAVGPGEGLEVHVLLNDVHCDGKEETVFECQHGGIGNHDCEHGRIAGVQCEPCDSRPCMNGGNCSSSHSGFICNCPVGFSGRFCEFADLRLVDGNTYFEGRLEIHTNGEWGTICGDLWGREESRVACRQLGFPDAVNATKGGRFGSGTVPIHFYNFTCTGNEVNLESCQHAGIGNHHCSHKEDAGVVCLPTARLANGSRPDDGRVEVYTGGKWGTICASADLNNANVVCRQLGFGRAVRAYSWPNLGQDDRLTTVIEFLVCSGEEKTVFDCQFFNLGFLFCGYNAGVRCGNIRLVNGSSRTEGRLEVFLNGGWGTVCDDFWDLENAQVACRQLGFPKAIGATQGGSFGNGAGPIHLDDVICTGQENDLQSCMYSGTGIHNCTHGEDVGLVCAPSVRLVNGSSSNEGRVEVYWDGSWGTVCDDIWDLRHANVVCRELGFPRALQALSGAAFGPGEGLEILLDDVYCSGDEETVFECYSHSVRSGSHDCDHDKDAGVQCEYLRLSGGSTAKEGRLEIFLYGQWGTICGNSWGLEDAHVACRHFDFPGAIMATSGGSFGIGTGPIHFGDVMCTGQENDLRSCPHAGVGVHNCTHDQDAGVVCAVPVRLASGLYSSEGRVELFLNGAWGAVCGYGWDLNDATVICLELGFIGVLQAVSGAAIGPGSDVAPIRVECSGEEETVVECRLWRYSSCQVYAEVKCEPGCVMTPDPSGLLLSAQQDVYLPGDSVEYTCPDGYQLHGSARRFCQSNSTWSGQPAKCLEDPCVSSPCLNQGNCTSESVRFKFFCQCRPGYDGPTCANAAHCVYEPDLSDGLIVTSGQRDVYLPGDTIEYRCIQGYQLSGSEKQICQSDLMWSEQRPKCIEAPETSVASVGPTVGGVIGGIILVIFVGLVVFIIIKRKTANKLRGDLAGIVYHSEGASSDAVDMESTQ